jgi:uncharacterized RDD family membrane protein YckC
MLLHDARNLDAPPLSARLPRRLGAMLYDGILLCAIWWCLGLLAVAMAGGEEVRPPHNRWLALALAASAYLYFAWPWVNGGQTLGMKTWRLVVCTESGGQLSWRQASVRFLAAVLAWLPCGLGYIWSLFDRDCRAWHDRISGTRLLVVSAAPAGNVGL